MNQTQKKVADEMSKLKFEGGLFQDANRLAANIVGKLVIKLMDDPSSGVEKGWNKNEWTCVEFLKAFADEARKQVQSHGNAACFAGDDNDPEDPTMGLIAHLIVEGKPKKEEPKPQQAKATANTKTTTTTSKAVSKPQPKPASKPKESVIQGNLFDDLLDF